MLALSQGPHCVGNMTLSEYHIPDKLVALPSLSWRDGREAGVYHLLVQVSSAHYTARGCGDMLGWPH